MCVKNARRVTKTAVTLILGACFLATALLIPCNSEEVKSAILKLYYLDRVSAGIDESRIESFAKEDQCVFSLSLDSESANGILGQLAHRSKVPPEKLALAMDDVGNTSCASIPITIQKYVEQGKIVAGSRLVLVGFGVGFSWAACEMTWG